MAKEEIQKLKEEAQANMEHMLQVLILHYEILIISVNCNMANYILLCSIRV